MRNALDCSHVNHCCKSRSKPVLMGEKRVTAETLACQLSRSRFCLFFSRREHWSPKCFVKLASRTNTRRGQAQPSTHLLLLYVGMESGVCQLADGIIVAYEACIYHYEPETKRRNMRSKRTPSARAKKFLSCLSALWLCAYFRRKYHRLSVPYGYKEKR